VTTFPVIGTYQPVVQPVVISNTRNNGLSIASMILGILWLYWVGSILALIFGYVALGQIKRSHGTQTGRGMAIAGIVLGWIGIATLVIVIIVAVNASNHQSSGSLGRI
jgi:hypothetical protein